MTFKREKLCDTKYNVWLYLGSPHIVPWDRIQQKDQVKSALCVGSGHVAYYTTENTTTQFIRSNRRMVYALDIIPVTFV